MDDKPILRYFTGEEADQFAFYRIPKQLFTNSYFRNLSTDAKVLYGLMLDRISLSVKNRWMDSQNHVYIYFSVEDTMEYLNCKKNKAIQIIAELDAEKGIGLIEKQRQGQGKPTRIYVKNFFIPVQNASEMAAEENSSDPEVGNINLQKLEKQTSRSLKNKLLEVGKTNPNNNEYNNTESNDIYSHLFSSGNRTDGEETEASRISVLRQIDYDNLIARNPMDGPLIDGICDLIQEILNAAGDTIVIASNRYPTELVKARFRTIDGSHIEFVIRGLKSNTTKVRNIRKYMLAALFNAPSTIDGYYQAEVNHDMPQFAKEA